MKKRIKKKYELLERIEYLENDFFKFMQDTVDVIEILADWIKRLWRQALILMDRKEVRLYEFLSTIGINQTLLTMITFLPYYLVTTPQNTREFLH